MEGKDSFVFHIKWFKYINKLNNGQKVLFFNLLENYVTDKYKDIPIEDISVGDPIVEMAFLPVANDLLQDLGKWKERCKTNKENGKLGGRPKKPNGLEENQTVIEETEKTKGLFEKPKKPDNEYEYDNEYEDDIKKEKSINTLKETEQALSTAVDVDLTDVPDVLSPEEQMFNEFWKLYPKKVDKKGALRSFKRVKGLKKEYPAMLEALNRELASEQWNRNNGQYIPHPTTWLNQERWKSVPVNTVETEEDVFKRFLEEC